MTGDQADQADQADRADRGQPASWWLAAVLVAVAATGCRARSATSAQGCKTDVECGGQACMAGECIDRGAPTGSWSAEMVPPSDSSAATTSINGIVFDGTPVAWNTRAKVTITGNLGMGATINGASHVVATVPPMIPGSPDLQFEGEWPASGKDMPAQFMLSVPDNELGVNATFSVLPTPPDDRKQAPISAPATLAANMSLSFSNDAITVHGRLLSAILKPLDGFLARAFQGTRLVSNVAETQDGIFSLYIPTSNVTTDPMHAITVELSPKDDASTDPRFTSHTIALGVSADLGDLHLPAYGQPNTFRFDVRGDSASGMPISTVGVQARTSIIGSPDGTADYAGSSVTNGQGIADLSLLPGTADALRAYDITFVPPPDSIFGVTCLPAFPLGAGGTPAAPALARKVALPRRAVVSGNLANADGAAVTGMTIAATRIGGSNPGADDACASAVAGAATVTSDVRGHYELRLDPGTYRLEYDPPAGAAVPRFTEPSLVVNGDAQHDLTLPPATLVEGTINGPTGEPLPSVLIHLYRITCGATGRPCMGPDRIEPLLRAMARTDNAGAFRMVVPQGSD